MITKKLNPLSQFADGITSSVTVHHEEPLTKKMSTITFNPLYGLDSEEYSDASIEQRELYIKSKCREAETVILTLSKMFEGEISNMEIPALNLSVACILKTNNALSPKECGHILSISRHLNIS
jgi:hypothetical protein